MVMRRDFQPAVYIMANHKGGTIYVGVTSDLPKRAWQHREGEVGGFTKRYGCKRLVWFELHATMEYAILREKQLKAGSRSRKITLIEAANPEWRDLFFDITTWLVRTGKPWIAAPPAAARNDEEDGIAQRR